MVVCTHRVVPDPQLQYLNGRLALAMRPFLLLSVVDDRDPSE